MGRQASPFTPMKMDILLTKERVLVAPLAVRIRGSTSAKVSSKRPSPLASPITAVAIMTERLTERSFLTVVTRSPMDATDDVPMTKSSRVILPISVPPSSRPNRSFLVNTTNRPFSKVNVAPLVVTQVEMAISLCVTTLLATRDHDRLSSSVSRWIMAVTTGSEITISRMGRGPKNPKVLVIALGPQT